MKNILQIRPHPEGGYELFCDNEFMLANLVWNDSGEIVKHSCKINKKSRGLGDTIAKMTKAVGIKPCGGCKKRQKKLNELVPYKNKGEI